MYDLSAKDERAFGRVLAVLSTLDDEWITEQGERAGYIAGQAEMARSVLQEFLASLQYIGHRSHLEAINARRDQLVEAAKARAAVDA